MKRTITLIAFLLLAATQFASGQAAILALIFGDKVASEKFNLSLELGVPITRVSNIENAEASNAINFGIGGNIKLSENWFLSPNVYFLSRRSFDVNPISLNSGDPDLDGLYTQTKAEFQLNYTDIHLLLAYEPNNSNFRFGLSPQVSFLGKARATFIGELGDFDQSVKSMLNKTDYGMIFNVGYFFRAGNKGKGLILNVRYYQGFADVFEQGYFTGNNKASYFSVHLSFPFVTDDLAKKNLEEAEKRKKKS